MGSSAVQEARFIETVGIMQHLCVLDSRYRARDESAEEVLLFLRSFTLVSNIPDPPFSSPSQNSRPRLMVVPLPNAHRPNQQHRTRLVRPVSKYPWLRQQSHSPIRNLHVAFLPAWSSRWRPKNRYPPGPSPLFQGLSRTTADYPLGRGASQ